MAPYAHLCTTCQHPVTAHRLAATADNVVDGPYDCYFQHCPCAISQTDPTTPIQKPEFDRRFPGYPRQLRALPTR